MNELEQLITEMKRFEEHLKNISSDLDVNLNITPDGKVDIEVSICERRTTSEQMFKDNKRILEKVNSMIESKFGKETIERYRPFSLENARDSDENREMNEGLAYSEYEIELCSRIKVDFNKKLNQSIKNSFRKN